MSDLPIPPSPTTPQTLDADFARYPSSHRVPHSRGSRLHLSPAGSPTLTGRIEFVILRMDRSPPVAPHPASRRRSYSWLQAGERIPEEDFHLSDQTRFQAHWNARSARVFGYGFRAVMGVDRSDSIFSQVQGGGAEAPGVVRPALPSRSRLVKAPRPRETFSRFHLRLLSSFVKRDFQGNATAAFPARAKICGT